MNHYQETVLRFGTGLAIAGAKVTVYQAGTTTKADLFTDDTGSTPLANPVTTDGLGTFSFYVADGNYDLLIRYRNIERLVPDVEICDCDGSGGGVVIPSSSFLLTEDGGFLLWEDGSRIILEA